MEYKGINFAEKLSLIDEFWSPRVIAEMNDYQFKLAKLDGQFVWHDHPDTDEVFVVLKGQLTIEFRDGAVSLGRGELFVVPNGVEHKPVADEPCDILLIEPRGVVNTGQTDGTLTAPNDVWV